MTSAPAQASIEIEDGVLALFGIEDADASADRPLIRRAPGDAEAWREVSVIRVDQPVTQAAVPNGLQRRQGANWTGSNIWGGPIWRVAKCDVIVKTAFVLASNCLIAHYLWIYKWALQWKTNFWLCPKWPIFIGTTLYPIIFVF